MEGIFTENYSAYFLYCEENSFFLQELNLYVLNFTNFKSTEKFNNIFIYLFSHQVKSPPQNFMKKNSNENLH